MGFFSICLLLIACGDLPKPFAQPSIQNKNPLIILDGGGAIRVEMDGALPAYLSKPLSENMIESLWEENIPASAAKGFNPRYLLRGELKIVNSSLFEAEKAEIMWTLTEVNNKKKKYYLNTENYTIRTDNVIFNGNVKVDNFKAQIVKKKSKLSVHSSATFENHKLS